ncbi:MAG TPA: molybdopterin-dependent oxidoreductase, partial [Acidobacteriota bacterium]|nr:molybdopterin-dependent oxidoreductase [Acidobacteriota bacterium]
GGLVRYIIENQRFFREYVVHYTNAGQLIREDFQDTEDLDGLFSGWDPESKRYSIDSWQYRSGPIKASAGHREVRARQVAHSKREKGEGPFFDPSLKHPHCVFQILKRHFSRYTPEFVEECCGVSKELFLRVAETLCDNSGPERTSAFCYAVGWTQHTAGVQFIRTAAIIQLLLGNIGRPGGGILALRGHSSIQGSTDIPTLFDLLPGYLPMPWAGVDIDLPTYIENYRAEKGWWGELPRYLISLLKAWYGDAATQENDWAYANLPRLTGDHSHLSTIHAMVDGRVKGYFVMGENPLVGSPHGTLQRKGLRNLDWMVVRDLVLTETAEFWKDAPEITSGEIRPEEIGTEVFFFPAASHVEKDGTFTNTQRLLQWHAAAIQPIGDARSELHFIYHLGRRLKKMAGTGVRDRAVRDLTWDYPVVLEREEPDTEAVLREINGFDIRTARPVSGFGELSDRGETACGCWIYSGCFADGINHPAKRIVSSSDNWIAPDWGWAWPANRRILYNRASADPNGKPWSDRKRYIWWDSEKSRWTGYDVPDFPARLHPRSQPASKSDGPAALAGTDPFIMQADGKGWLFVPHGLLDGPLPTHYEPHESVTINSLYQQQSNPVRMKWRRQDNVYHEPFRDPRFPYLITTYRLTEHHTAGGMSRWLSWLSELQPEFFCEVSPELAAETGLVNGGWATISTARAQVEVRVLITSRVPSLTVGGRVIHQIGLPFHWGRKGLVTGDSANDLIPLVGDPNVSIQESKALTG